MGFRKDTYIQNVSKIPECVIIFDGDKDNAVMVRQAETVVSEIMFLLENKFNRNLEKFEDKLQSHKVWEKLCEEDKKIVYEKEFDTIGLIATRYSGCYTLDELIDNNLPVMVIDIDTSSKNIKLSFCGSVIGVIGSICDCFIRNEYRSYVIQDIGNTVYTAANRYHNLWLENKYLPDLSYFLITDLEDDLAPGDMYWDGSCKENRKLYAAVAVPSSLESNENGRVYVVNSDGHNYMKEFFPFDHAKVLDANGVEIGKHDSLITDVNDKGDKSIWEVLSVNPDRRYPVSAVKVLPREAYDVGCKRDLKPEWCRIQIKHVPGHKYHNGIGSQDQSFYKPVSDDGQWIDRIAQNGLTYEIYVEDSNGNLNQVKAFVQQSDHYVPHRGLTLCDDAVDGCKEKECVREQIEDPVNHPSHYETDGIECIDAMVASQGVEAAKSFCICNAFKYIWRNQHKNSSLEDIKKAQWYINKYLELEDE